MKTSEEESKLRRLFTTDRPGVEITIKDLPSGGPEGITGITELEELDVTFQAREGSFFDSVVTKLRGNDNHGASNTGRGIIVEDPGVGEGGREGSSVLRPEASFLNGEDISTTHEGGEVVKDLPLSFF